MRQLAKDALVAALTAAAVKAAELVVERILGDVLALGCDEYVE